MTLNWEALDFAILGPAFIAGLIIISTHIPLGKAVLSRGIIFIDLAIAQIAGLGIIAADFFGWESHGWEIQVVAVSAAMFGAIFLHWTEKRFSDIQEAIIGIVFVLAANMGLILLANNPHGGENLKELLVGQILWVTYEQLWPVALIYAAVLACWHFLDIPNRHRLNFYLLFAIVVTASVQMVGVYLVFASLIIPALTTLKLEAKRQLVSAYLVGASGFAIGLIISALIDLPSGAVTVWIMAMLGIVFAASPFAKNKAS